jgi:hypothetical protein
MKLTTYHHPMQRSRMSYTITLLQPTYIPSYFTVNHKIPYSYGTYTARGIYLLVVSPYLFPVKRLLLHPVTIKLKKNHSFISCMRKHHERKNARVETCVLLFTV